MQNRADKKEIWLFIDSLSYGGIETHVLELAKGLISFGQPVKVILVKRYQDNQPLVDKLDNHQIPYQFLAELLPTKRTQPLLQLIDAIKYYQPRLVHAHGYKAAIISRLACRLTNLPQFTTFHAGETPTGKVRFYDFIDRLSAPWSRYNFSVSQQVEEKVFGQAEVINNFVSVKSVEPSVASHIAFVGRLSHEKAPDRFVALARHFPDKTFHVYGSGPLEGSLRNDSPRNIIYHGHKQTMDSEWSHIDILIIPSRFEGLPMAALEAMSMRVPVIAANVGALPTLIEQGVNGWIGSSLNELVQHLQHWLTLSEHQKQTIRQHARHTISENYSANAIIPILLNRYAEQLPN